MSCTILEGPDGAGKTRLAAAWLAYSQGTNQTTSMSAHGPYLGQDEIAFEYLEDLMYGRRPGHHVIMDRSWLSEAIYGPVARGTNRIDVARRRVLERVALSANTVVVYCLPSLNTCVTNYLKRKALEYLPNESQLAEVYRRFYQESIYPVRVLRSYQYDYTRDDPQTFIEDVERSRALPHPRWSTGLVVPTVGHFARDVTLLVGDQVNPGTTAVADLPFVSWDPQGCTAWLSEQLEAWGVSEASLCWVNARDPHGYEASSRFLSELQPRQIISMGEAARAWVANSGFNDITSYHVVHPQYHRRFLSKEGYPLRECLTNYRGVNV